MRAFVVLAVFVVFVVFGACPVFGQATARVSVTSGGIEGNRESSYPSISADGRYVAFESMATNLIPGGTSGVRHIFVRDMLTGAIKLASISSSGIHGDNQSGMPCISPDGRYVAFWSASILAPGPLDYSGVYVHDLQTRETTVETDRSQATYSLPSICSGGRFLALYKDGGEIYLRDRQRGTTIRVAGNSDFPSLSSDGRFLVFSSTESTLVPNDNNNASDAFVHDNQTGVISRVSVSSSGTEGNNGSSLVTSSADGRWIAFLSDASNLVGGDTNNFRDAFVHDRRTGQTICISVAANGAQANGESRSCVIAPDGRTGIFCSGATNLIPGGLTSPNRIHAYAHDIQTGRTKLLSVDSAGVEANFSVGRDGGGIFPSTTSSDSRYVAFDSLASNLVLDDENGVRDVFVRDLAPFASGTVNAGIGPITDVLFANGESRVLNATVGFQVQIRCAPPPAGPNTSTCLLFIWFGLPTQQTDFVLFSQNVGGTINPTFLNIEERPQPIGWMMVAVPFWFNFIFPVPLTITLQGVIVDNGAGNPANISVTNAVILKVR